MMERLICYHMSALAAGILLDMLIGDPHGIPHPVVYIGRLISALEVKLYPKRGGALCVIVILVSAVICAALTVGAYLISPWAGVVIEAVLTCYILAARSLRDESMKVYRALTDADIDTARYALSMIVGRDTDRLNETGIIRAAVETVAENTSDGVIAPLIYTALGGPVLGMVYKAINTMDSMIAYHNERYEIFGKAAAKIDDAAGFIPSRISALLMIVSAGILRIFDKAYDPKRAYRIWRRDRRKHLSPNSAQTESACAGALGIALGGVSYYKGVPSNKPVLGDDIRAAYVTDIRRATGLMFVSEGVLCVIIYVIFGLWIL